MTFTCSSHLMAYSIITMEQNCCKQFFKDIQVKPTMMFVSDGAIQCSYGTQLIVSYSNQHIPIQK